MFKEEVEARAHVAQTAALTVCPIPFPPAPFQVRRPFLAVPGDHDLAGNNPLFDRALSVLTQHWSGIGPTALSLTHPRMRHAPPRPVGACSWHPSAWIHLTPACPLSSPKMLRFHSANLRLLTCMFAPTSPILSHTCPEIHLNDGHL